MTKDEIEQVFERVRTWSMERQEEAAAMLLVLEEQGTEPYELTEEERADIEAALEEVERGDLATDDEVQAVFNRYRHA
jgi:predicted transcriptional regulator